MKGKTIITKSPEETKDLAYNFGKLVLKKDTPLLIALEGDLGSGKTTFVQGFSQGLGIKEDINSPTFLIFKKYPLDNSRFFYHFDAYRVNEKDLLDLDFKEIIGNKKNIVIVEWSENIKNILPTDLVKISFQFIEPDIRKLIIRDDNGIMVDI